MDKYQLNLIKKVRDVSLLSEEGIGTAVIDGDRIILTQNENYHIMNYVLKFTNPAVEEIISSTGETFKPNDEGCFTITIDFTKKIETINLIFANNVADSCTMSVEYVTANKEEYDKKIDEKYKAKLVNAANIHVKTGIYLINIYWNFASTEVTHSKICLYEYYGGKTTNNFMCEFIPDPNVFYLSVTGLAPNNYIVQVKQFDKNNKEIISVDNTITICDPIQILRNSITEVKTQVAANKRNIVGI